MSVIISPAALATTASVANQASVTAQFTEKLCNKVCVNSSVQPQYTIQYSYSTPTLSGTTVFVPITAVITIVTPGCCNCGRTRIFNESFTIAFQGQTAIPTAVTITSLGREGAPSSIQCCKASSYTITDSLTVLIA